MQPPALNHVALHISNIGCSRQFYEDVLRLTPLPRPAFSFEGLWFRLGADQELHLICRGPVAEHPPRRDNHFALLVDDIDEWESHLRSVAANFQPAKKRPDGATQIFLIDPDGHHIELCTRPDPGLEMIQQ